MNWSESIWGDLEEWNNCRISLQNIGSAKQDCYPNQEDQGEKNWDMKLERQSCKLSDQIFYYYFIKIVLVGWNPLD